MIVDILLECGCSPDKVFKNKTTYNNHLRSQKHKKWEDNRMMRNYKKNETEYENILSGYKLKLKNKEIENRKLLLKLEEKENIIYYYIKNFVIIQLILLIKYS
tara:strand:- start:131 stop:439 length:309 start_codon:yes stop_codon:yes gene_type:complete